MKGILKTAGPLFLITVFCAACLGLAYGVTAEPIKAARRAEKQKILRAALPAARYENIEINEGQTAYNAEITEILAGYEGDLPRGYVFEASSTGYAGGVTVYVAIDTYGRVYSVTIGANNETPGLGSNAGNPAFTNQFISASSELALTKNAPAENEIAAVTGATRTSRAVTNCVNAALGYYAERLKP